MTHNVINGYCGNAQMSQIRMLLCHLWKQICAKGKQLPLAADSGDTLSIYLHFDLKLMRQDDEQQCRCWIKTIISQGNN